MVDNEYKVVTSHTKKGEYELYNLAADPKESKNLAKEEPERLKKMVAALEAWDASVTASEEGKDYPEGKVLPGPESHFWMTDKRYEPYFDEWRKRPEYAGRLKRKSSTKKPSGKKPSRKKK